ncbi:MAG TPA: DUF885 family protein, partial [Terriglobales bacterium]|nr:DUF885 family protein [Terriglobales bacterium]
MTKRSLVLAICLATIFPSGTGALPQPKVESVDQLVDRYFDTYFRFHPTIGTINGFHQYDGQLEDFSKPNLDREAAALEALLPDFQKALAARPDQAKSDDLTFLESQTHSRLLELKTIRMWQKDPDLYGSAPAYSIFVLMKRNFAPPQDRLRSVIARERQIPALFSAGRHNLENPPKVYTEVALEQLPGTIDFFRKDVPSAFSAVQDAQLLKEFQAVNSAVIAEYEKYQAFLHDDLLPVSRGDFRLGADTFRKKLLYDEMVDIPLDRLREIGYSDLHKNQQRLR